MDRLEAMTILIEAVEAGSFSAASRKLGVPLPTISRKISELETHLKTRLLVRSTRKLALTDSGVAYLAASKRILDQVNDAEAAASGEYVVAKGELIVTAPIAFGRLHVLPVIEKFLESFPLIDIRMLLSDRTAHLIDDHIDMAVRIGTLPDSSMIATRIGSVRRVVCGSPAFFAKHGTPKTPEDLAALDCVSFDADSTGREWSFPTTDRRGWQSVVVRSRLAVNTAAAAIDAAIAGIGVTSVLSYQSARAVADGTLQIVLKPFQSDPLPVNLLHAAQGKLPLKMRSFLEFAVPRLRKALPEDAGAARG